ncbi:putative uncharacterized transposon-derived protein F54H12.3 [Trichonephila clavipes]|nr:putative uncharacterized transposon-derived protein F54H12.3 [Trichonephila clavipes]
MEEQFQADLLDLQSLSQYNNGYKYLLTCIDVFSKYAWAIPLRDKKSKSILKGFEKIFRKRKPLSLQTDKGTEFKNKAVQTYFKNMNVHFFTTNNETKVSIVERFHRTLMSKMTKYFAEYNIQKYINVIEKLISSYNHTWHRSIKMEPFNVNIDNQGQVWQNLYGDISETKVKRPVFKINDKVRISKWKGRFDKGYENNWSIEIFIIYKILPRNPFVYMLKDLKGEIIEGTFYERRYKSDIVQPVVVGHVEAPLLRVVRISGDDGDAVSAQYDRPHYVPVIRQSFYTIEIEIRLNSGDLLPFERGKVIVVLHFRMRQLL